MARRSEARLGKARMTAIIKSWPGTARSGEAQRGQAWFAKEWLGPAGYGKDNMQLYNRGRPQLGWAVPGEAWLGEAEHGKARITALIFLMARLGTAEQGKARRRKARITAIIKSRRGTARYGSVRQGGAG